MVTDLTNPGFWRKFSLYLILAFASLLIACGDDEVVTPEFSATISLSTSSNSISENGGSFSASVSIDQENSSGIALSIPIQFSGTATSGEDYQPVSQSITIASGATSGEINIRAINDMTVEGDEEIILSINSNQLPASVSPGASTSISIIILDDDSNSKDCDNDNSIDQDNHVCDETPNVANTYSESVASGERTITTNGIPTHDFRNQIPQIVSMLNSSTKVFTMDATPSVGGMITSITSEGNPVWKFGVALNGVPIDPAPAQPFIFENQNTGEFNFDWVFEPNWNMDAVGLDCAIAHVQPDGTYHYHGDMSIYADQLSAGIGTGNTTPNEPVQIGWAADGFPILYKFGPDAMGNIKKLKSSYQLKSGERPGDGITEPCGPYNGKYTNDFEFSSGSGDLDECNGVERSITLNGETFGYFYVITDDFPVISRCMVGAPDRSFRLGGG